MVSFSGLKISVKVLSIIISSWTCKWALLLILCCCISIPFSYFRISDLNRERREKLSKDFYFQALPTEMQDVSHKINSIFFFIPNSFSRVRFFLLCYFLSLITSKDFTISLYLCHEKKSHEPRGIFYFDALWTNCSMCLSVFYPDWTICKGIFRAIEILHNVSFLLLLLIYFFPIISCSSILYRRKNARLTTLQCFTSMLYKEYACWC